MNRNRVVVLAVAAAVVIMVAVTWVVLRPSPGSADPQSAARTVFSDLEPASASPTLPGLADLHPAPGQIVQAPGPFDDRFHFEKLAFNGTVLTGEVAITSDVSDVLDLETQAGFYDRDGELLGTASDAYHLDDTVGGHEEEGAPHEDTPFRIAVPQELRGRAVAVAVGVFVLVNE